MAGRNTFDGRVAELQRRVGAGKLRGSLVRGLSYSAAVHERLDVHHPVGQPKFQEAPLYANYPRYLRMVADTVLSPEGPTQGMADAMEAFNRDSAAVTPKETTALARSGHVQVSSGGRLVVDKPPQGGPSGGNPARDRARRRRGR